MTIPQIIWTGKALLLGGWLSCLWLLYRHGRFGYALAGTLWLAAVSVVFGILPSPVGYSLPCTSCDMAAYVAIAHSMAVGNPIGESYFAQGVPEVLCFGYPAMVAVVHRLTSWDIVKIFQYGGAVALCLAMCLFTFFAYRPSAVNAKRAGDTKKRLWTGLFIGVFLFFLSDPPFSFAVAAHTYDFGDFWSLVVIPKPGHVLSYGLIPLVLWAYSSPRTWLSAVLAGVALGIMMQLYLVVALFTGSVLALYSLLLSRWEAGGQRPEFRRLLLAFVVTAATGAPYWLPIISNLNVAGLAQNYSTGGGNGAASPDFIEPLMEIARDFDLMFFALIGLVVLIRRKGRGEMLLLSCVATAFGLFTANKIMAHLVSIDLTSLLKFPYLFLRQSLAFPAGVGLYAAIRYIVSRQQDIAGFLGRLFPSGALQRVPSTAAVALLALTPLMAPVWHYPLFNNWASLGASPLSDSFTSLADWIRSNTKGEAVFLSEPDLGMYICTFTGRKAWLVPEDKLVGNFLVNVRERRDVVRRAFSDSSMAAKTLCRAGVDYVVWSEKMESLQPRIDKESLEGKNFKRVYATDNYEVFKVVGCDRPEGDGGP